MNRIIGFIGSDAYDIILYLARICYKQKEKVLLVDNSINKSLFHCIPYLVGLDSSIDYIDYLGVDFTTIEAEYINKCEYDKVFIYYGLHKTNADYSLCTNYILISDIQLHTLLAIKEIGLNSDKIMHIIMRDVYEVMRSDNKVLEILHFTGDIKIYTLYLDAWDIKYRIQCQEKNLTSFHRISNYLKDYLLEISKVLYPEQSSKVLNNVIKKALKDNCL